MGNDAKYGPNGERDLTGVAWWRRMVWFLRFATAELLRALADSADPELIVKREHGGVTTTPRRFAS